MNNELVHIPRCIWEAESSNAIAAGFGCAECQCEERDIGRREDGEVVGHFCGAPFLKSSLDFFVIEG